MKFSLALLVLGLLPMAQAQMAPHTPPSPASMAQHEVQHYTTLLSLTPGPSGASDHFLHRGSRSSPELMGQRTGCSPGSFRG